MTMDGFQMPFTNMTTSNYLEPGGSENLVLRRKQIIHTERGSPIQENARKHTRNRFRDGTCRNANVGSHTLLANDIYPS